MLMHIKQYFIMIYYIVLHYIILSYNRLARELGLPRAATPQDRLAAFLGLDLRPAEDDDSVVLRGIRLAAMYRVHCYCRHGRLRRGPAAAEALRQACREVVKGHRRACSAYDAAQAAGRGRR